MTTNPRPVLLILPLLIACIFLGSIDSAMAVSSNTVRQTAKHAPELILIVVALFGKLAGIGAVVGAGLFARGKPLDMKKIAYALAAAGGVWTAYNWFGWPFREVIHTGSSYFGIAPTTDSEFSFLRLIGCAILAYVAYLVCIKLSDKDETSPK